MKRIKLSGCWAIVAWTSALAATASASESATFTRITQGVIATDQQVSIGVTWGDYDGDGRLDVYFTSTATSVGALYHNTGMGTFERINNEPIATAIHHGAGCAWADFDNDGDLDLFRADYGAYSHLYQNEGGSFAILNYENGKHSMGVAWGDYDNDGHLDLFLPNGGPEQFAVYEPNFLYRNNGNGALVRVSAAAAGPVVGSADSSWAAVWTDLNGDGLLDLFVLNYGRANSLFLGTPNHQFVKVSQGSLVTESQYSTSCAVADYDNDGDLDIFVANTSSYPIQDQGQPNALYRNDGGGMFTRIMAGDIATDIGQSLGAAWADYDNDGWLDLFVSNGESLTQNNFLYHNNGDGTFSRVLTGNIVNNGGHSFGCAWGDYDNDGFLDLIVANGLLFTAAEPNFLYHNDGNANHWIRIKCEGTTSNRSGIGAKVRVRATIGGNTFWQLREINSGNGFCGNAIDAHFGLGDAAKVEVLRVEWPSGIVQELNDLTTDKVLTVTEPLRLESLAAGQLQVHAWKGQDFQIEASSNLRDWALLQSITPVNSTGVVPIADPDAATLTQRYYRATPALAPEN